ncbi:hypothetical protein BS47DRAFT_1360546 [Hydnum rufescens UP504]|uniref:Uncharacterized protein n=1 Tax=Hydnum rufescens UP504 TaxID=1448309 RepID=A0A9P6B2F7_9AGAM|nr:hypothetical protein BS47DRAFT_1360546 [Hydnum rufescens UP504]
MSEEEEEEAEERLPDYGRQANQEAKRESKRVICIGMGGLVQQTKQAKVTADERMALKQKDGNHIRLDRAVKRVGGHASHWKKKQEVKCDGPDNGSKEVKVKRRRHSPGRLLKMAEGRPRVGQWLWVRVVFKCLAQPPPPEPPRDPPPRPMAVPPPAPLSTLAELASSVTWTSHRLWRHPPGARALSKPSQLLGSCPHLGGARLHEGGLPLLLSLSPQAHTASPPLYPTPRDPTSPSPTTSWSPPLSPMSPREPPPEPVPLQSFNGVLPMLPHDRPVIGHFFDRESPIPFAWVLSSWDNAISSCVQLGMSDAEDERPVFQGEGEVVLCGPISGSHRIIAHPSVVSGPIAEMTGAAHEPVKLGQWFAIDVGPLPDGFKEPEVWLDLYPQVIASRRLRRKTKINVQLLLKSQQKHDKLQDVLQGWAGLVGQRLESTQLMNQVHHLIGSQVARIWNMWIKLMLTLVLRRNLKTF